MDSQVSPALRSPRFVQWGAQLEAEVAGYAGDARLCAAAVERAANAGLFDLLWLERCPLLEPARGEPEYPAAHAAIRARADEIVEAVWS